MQEEQLFASCNGGRLLASGERVSSFAIQAASGAPAVVLHGLTSRPLRSAPPAVHAAAAQRVCYRPSEMPKFTSSLNFIRS